SRSQRRSTCSARQRYVMTWRSMLRRLRTARTLMPSLSADSAERLTPTAKWGAYLAWGSVVALYLGHRRSVDLDWFAPRATPPALWIPRRIACGELARCSVYAD